MSVRKTLTYAFVAGTLFALAACGGSGQREKNGEIVLHVGDQLGVVQATLESAGEAQPKGYSIEWANFTSGPLIIAAQTGGSVDLGWMAETPLIFAQAAGSPVKVVAVNRPAAKPDGKTGYPYALVVLPNSPIHSVAQLKGKSVAYRTGTVLHYMVARQLADAGLTLKDIKPLEVTSYDTSLLEKGAADAQTLNEPFLTKLVDAGKVRVLAQGGPPVTPGLNYLVASDKALADPKRAKAIGDFVIRLARANHWQNAHPAEAAAALSKVYRTDPRTAQKIIERTPQEYAPIDQTVIEAHQTEADLFHGQGLIRKRLDAKTIFDTRFNALVAQTEAK
jgi:sulfonate transport system substrate-binding protein